MSLFTKVKSWVAKIKSWPTKKKLIISLATFAVVAIGVTAGLIVWQNGRNNQPEIVRYKPDQIVGKKYPDESHLLVKSLDEVYHTNSLEWIYNEKKISGLKNKTIEDKINKEIAKTLQEVKDSPMAKGANKKGTAECNVTANFGNILSVKCYRSDDYYKGDEYVSTFEIGRYLNYRLATGEPLKFTDIFTAGANYSQIIVEAYGYTSAEKNKQCTDYNTNCQEGWGDHVPKYSVDYEEQLVKLIRGFNAPGDTQFYLSPSGVTFTVSGEQLHFNFTWNYSQVAIYKRFVGDDGIYDNNNKLYAFVFVDYAEAYIFGKTTDNLFTDCTILSYGSRDDAIKKLKESMDDKVRELSSLSGDQMAILVCVGFSENDSDISVGFTIHKMTKAYYDKTAHSRVVEYCHRPKSDFGPCADPYSRDDWNDSLSEYVNKNITTTRITEYYYLKDNKWIKETENEHNARLQQEAKNQVQKDKDENCKKNFPGSVRYDAAIDVCLMPDGSQWIDMVWYNGECNAQHSGTHYARETNECVADVADAGGNFATYPFP
ncbi:hypothetical protein FWC31_02290 [Candidatus Saccharibacteria bacterium]|nr:hypothetical protein [Candidatus Saccharibacteria bacterium]